MSDGPSRAADPLRRRRISWVAGLWIAAALVVIAQWALLDWQIAGVPVRWVWGDFSMRPEVIWGFLLSFPLAGGAIFLQARWTHGVWRVIAAIEFLLLLVASGELVFLRGPMAPDPVHAVRLQDGRQFILASNYVLYESRGPFGLYYRAADLYRPEYSYFDGAFWVIPSPSQRWLLAARKDVWAECFDLSTPQLQNCNVPPGSQERDPNYWSDVRLRSEQIAALTGIQPPTECLEWERAGRRGLRLLGRRSAAIRGNWTFSIENLGCGARHVRDLWPPADEVQGE